MAELGLSADGIRGSQDGVKKYTERLEVLNLLQSQPQLAQACYTAVNKHKTAAGMATGRPIRRLVLAASPGTLSRLRPVSADVMAAGRPGRGVRVQ